MKNESLKKIEGNFVDWYSVDHLFNTEWKVEIDFKNYAMARYGISRDKKYLISQQQDKEGINSITLTKTQFKELIDAMQELYNEMK